MTPRPRSLVPPFALALALAFTSGCLKLGNDTDLHLVCERKTTSPWHPYAPDDLARMTTVLTAGREVPPAEERALLSAAASAILTMGGAPYREFNATMQPYYEPSWVVQAWGNGTSENASGRDLYSIYLFEKLDGTATLEGATTAPPTIRDAALGIVARTQETQHLATVKSFAGATWDGALPGCVALEYDPIPPPCGPSVTTCMRQALDPRDVTTVTVNVDKGVVVSRVDGRSPTS